MIHPEAELLPLRNDPLVYGLTNGYGQLVYIGSGNIARVCSQLCAFRLMKGNAQVIYQKDRQSAFTLERELIAKFLPPMNKMLPKTLTEKSSWIDGRTPKWGLRGKIK